MTHKTFCIQLYLLLFPLAVLSQTQEAAYKFLQLPYSAKVAGAGGANVSVADNDLSLLYSNPALLSPKMSGTIALDYLNYFLSINGGSAAYGQSANDRATWAVSLNFLDYGSFISANAADQIQGSFSVQDISFNGTFAYKLTPKWTGGVTARLVTCFYEQYFSMGLGFDLGLHYYNPDTKFSFGLAVKNIGTQLIAFDQSHYELMPWDVQLGLSQRLAHAPFRFSVTFQNLNRWNFGPQPGAPDQAPTSNEGQQQAANIARGIFEHLVLGIDIIPKRDNFYFSIGYNFQRSLNLSVSQGSFFTGFTLGAGVRIKQFEINAAAAQYHQSGWTLQLSLAARLSDFIKPQL